MNTETALKKAGELLGSWAVETLTPESNRVDVILDARHLTEAIAALDNAHWGYLAGITGLDLGVETNIIEVLYHFCEGAAVVTLRIRTARDKASVPTICEIIPAASFYERELWEMLGVEVVGMSNHDHLFLPDDWTEGVYPLRKDAALT